MNITYQGVSPIFECVLKGIIREAKAPEDIEIIIKQVEDEPGRTEIYKDSLLVIYLNQKETVATFVDMAMAAMNEVKLRRMQHERFESKNH